jgi:hypothetical protein
MESLESQNKMFEEKLSLSQVSFVPWYHGITSSHFSQQPSSNYQNQLDRRREMLDSAELNMKSQVSQLESQLQRARDMINSQVSMQQMF